MSAARTESSSCCEVAPLAGLTKLQYLELSNNQIVKVDDLRKLTSLSSLYLTGNKISDVNALDSTCISCTAPTGIVENIV